VSGGIGGGLATLQWSNWTDTTPSPKQVIKVTIISNKPSVLHILLVYRERHDVVSVAFNAKYTWHKKTLSKHQFYF
jgi:hypothetical protein